VVSWISRNAFAWRSPGSSVSIFATARIEQWFLVSNRHNSSMNTENGSAPDHDSRGFSQTASGALWAETLSPHLWVENDGLKADALQANEHLDLHQNPEPGYFVLLFVALIGLGFARPRRAS